MSGRIAWLAVVAVLVTVLAVGAAPARAGAGDDPASWLAQARVYAERIDVPDGRAALFVSIGTGYVEAGLLEEARPLLAAAAAYGEQCKGCYAKAQRLADVAFLQHRAGDPLGAERTFRLTRKVVDELGTGADRVRALGYLGAWRKEAGEAMVARRLFAEAFEAVKGLEEAEQREALGDLALTLHLAGESKMSRAAVAQVRRPRPPVVFDLWLAQVEEQAEAGELKEANTTLERLGRRPRLRLSGLCALVEAYARAGACQAVLEASARKDATALARSFADPAERVEALAEVLGVTTTEAEAKALLEEASQTALKVADRTLKVEANLRLARAAHAAGLQEVARERLEVAIVVAASELGAEEDDLQHVSIARVAAALDDVELADVALKRIDDSEAAVDARLSVAGAAVRHERKGRALAMLAAAEEAMQAWGAERRAATQGLSRRAAVLQARLGLHDRARATVEAIGKTSPFNAATACTYIARDLNQEGVR